MKFLLSFALTISVVQSYRNESLHQIYDADPTHVEHARIKTHDISESFVGNKMEIKEWDEGRKNLIKSSKKSKKVKKKTKNKRS